MGRPAAGPAQLLAGAACAGAATNRSAKPSISATMAAGAITMALRRRECLCMAMSEVPGEGPLTGASIGQLARPLHIRGADVACYACSATLAGQLRRASGW